jgi:hypothetical protein
MLGSQETSLRSANVDRPRGKGLRQMRKTIATLTVAFSTLTVAAPALQAAPSEVIVRIEGRSETLFEGPILTDGHNVKASSDKKAPASGRRCNGLNNGQNPTPGPTPTAAGVDAMSILDEDFDGDWYAEPFEDYFVTRWGPDAQDEGNGEYWGIVVNNVFTGTGGCQYQLDGGDEVLWVYDAFKQRPRLALYPAGYTGGPRLLTATAELGEPFAVQVDAWDGYVEGAPPDSPQRTGSEPFEGAEVAPVTVGPGGFEKVDAGSASMVATDEEGSAEITFDDPGWHRIKATKLAPGGGESAVRSNRLDVCVPEPPAGDCGELPPDDQVRVPDWVPLEEDDEVPPPIDVPPAVLTPNSPLLAAPRRALAARVSIELPRLDRRQIARGLVRVSWRVLDPGVGIGRWTISSRELGGDGARFSTRATGRERTSALLRLPPGAAYRLRFTVVDLLGRSSTATIGKVRVPA